MNMFGRKLNWKIFSLRTAGDSRPGNLSSPSLSSSSKFGLDVILDVRDLHSCNTSIVDSIVAALQALMLVFQIAQNFFWPTLPSYMSSFDGALTGGAGAFSIICCLPQVVYEGRPYYVSAVCL